MEDDLKNLSKEERRKILKQRLRNKINSKAGNRMTKKERNDQISKATEQISDIKQKGFDIDKLLKTMVPDARSRKINRKRLKKFLEKNKKNKEQVDTQNKTTDEEKNQEELQ